MYAYVSTAVLSRRGVTKTQIRLALECCLRRVARGRYVVTHVCDDPVHRVLWETIESGATEELTDFGDMRDEIEGLKVLIRARAEHLALRELDGRGPAGREVLSHLSAALVHDLPLSRVVEHRVEAVRSIVSRTYPHLRVRRRETPSEQVMRIGIYRVTTLERTLIDVARDHPLDVAVPMLDHALRHGLTTLERIESDLADCVETAGAGQIRTALDLADASRESVAESVCAVRFFEHGILGFEPQVTIWDSTGAFLGRVDFCHRGAMTIVEVDGLGKYYLGSRVPRVELERERAREEAIRAAGYRVIRLTWKQLFRPESFRKILELTAARTRRA